MGRYSQRGATGVGIANGGVRGRYSITLKVERKTKYIKSFELSVAPYLRFSLLQTLRSTKSEPESSNNKRSLCKPTQNTGNLIRTYT